MAEPEAYALACPLGRTTGEAPFVNVSLWPQRVLTGQCHKLHLANYSLVLEQGPEVALWEFWGRRTLGAFMGNHHCTQEGLGPAEVAQVPGEALGLIFRMYLVGRGDMVHSWK